MNTIIFSFGNSFWLQLHNTAMGPPTAPTYSILSHGHDEKTAILTSFKDNLLYYKQYIDEVLGIWVDTEEKAWDQFKEQLNNFGSLKWNIEHLCTSKTFLDLHITIKEDPITTTTYQKLVKLYLYIPPLTAHLLSCFKGFRMGKLQCYWHQNSITEDFTRITSLFIEHLLQREHLLHQITPFFKSAASALDNRVAYGNSHKSQNSTNCNNETLGI